MSYKLVVEPEALAETAEIYAYHKEIGQALADCFDKALDTCYKDITRNPTGYQVRMKNYRHAMLRKFRSYSHEKTGVPPSEFRSGQTTSPLLARACSSCPATPTRRPECPLRNFEVARQLPR